MSNFKIWIDNPIGGTNVVTPGEFEDEDQREYGFKAGTPASSILVNTALRQSNLITTALMETIGESANDLSVLSTLDSVKNVINTYMLNSSSRTVNFTQESSRTNLISGETLSRSLGKISKYISDLDNSSVVGCQASNWANYARYASSDTSKGTIEARLTALGFKTDSITLTGGTPYITGASNEIGNAVLKRQGNYVLIEFNVLNSNYCWANNQQIGTIPLYDGKPAFFPSSTQVYNIGGRCCFRSGYVLYENLNCSFTLTITTDGKINISNVVWSDHDGTNYKDISGEVYSFKITIGYEANPLSVENDPSQDDPDGLIPDENDINDKREEESGDDEFW